MVKTAQSRSGISQSIPHMRSLRSSAIAGQSIVSKAVRNRRERDLDRFTYHVTDRTYGRKLFTIRVNFIRRGGLYARRQEAGASRHNNLISDPLRGLLDFARLSLHGDRISRLG
jgi:hypothetical protein